MTKRTLSVLCLGLMASLTAASVVQSAGVGAKASVTIVVSPPVPAVCDEPTSGATNLRCRVTVTLQVLNDGTLIGKQGVSLTVTREADASNAATITLAYD